MPTPLIHVNQLSRRYAQNNAVDNISFTLNLGEVLGFLGPNGAGKSTTMQMLTGNIAASSGSISIMGLDIIEQASDCKRLIGYCPETPPLYKQLTVDEYLVYCAQLHGVNKNQIIAYLDDAKQQCGLGDVSNRLIGNLSKGYQQRVGIAQAIIHKPKIIILDEPTVGLDPIQIVEIRNLIKQLGQDCGVILSTHILPEVQATCDRVQIIKKGQLVFHASIDELNIKQQTSSFIFGCSQLPNIEKLQCHKSITEIQAIDEQRVLIQYQGENPASVLAKKAVQNLWGLFELSPQKTSLEDIFVQLTRDEEHPQ